MVTAEVDPIDRHLLLVALPAVTGGTGGYPEAGQHLYTVPVVFVVTAGGEDTGPAPAPLHPPPADPALAGAGQVMLGPGVGPAGGHEDVVSVDHLLTQTARQVELDGAEWFPATWSREIFQRSNTDRLSLPAVAPGLLQKTQIVFQFSATSF